MTGRKSKEEHWAFVALRKRLSEKAQTVIPSADKHTKGEPKILRIITIPDWENGTIFLFDPELKREIDKFFYDTLYPQILAVFENEPFEIPPIDKINLRDNRESSIEASRQAIFIINDPKRPVHSEERPWWYIRFKLDIKPSGGYRLSTELILSIPFWLESDWTLDFIIDARNWANTPTLGTDCDELTLKFSWGYGTYYSFTNEEDTEFISPFRKHLQIAKSIDRFSESPENRFLKSYMLQSIKEMYGTF